MDFEDFDSVEEFHFYNWLLEAEAHGLVSDIEYQPVTFQLSERALYTKEIQYKTKVKQIEKTRKVTKVLLRACEYTPDFRFNVHNDRIQSVIKNSHAITYRKTIVDTKGFFQGRKNNSAITFPVKAKWLYQTQGIYVEKVIPEKLFGETFVPGIARLSPKRKQPVKKYLGYKTIKEFVKENF